MSLARCGANEPIVNEGGAVMKGKLCQMNAEYAGKPTTTINLTMPAELFEYVSKTAALEGKDPGTIINCFVQQGLLNSRGAIKRLEFAEHARGVLQKQGIQQGTIDEIFNEIMF